MSSNYTAGQDVITTRRSKGVEAHRPGKVVAVKQTAKGAFVSVQIDGGKTQAFRPVNVRAA